jgi:transcriptional regulator with XRE-family HTH domain
MEKIFGNKRNNCQLWGVMTGSELKVLRIKCGMTQEQLADKIGTHKSVISRWEKGRSNISKSSQKLIEAVLK